MKTAGREICASLVTLCLVWGVSSEAAWAKAFDMEMLGITVTAKNPADQAGPNTFYVNARLRVECRYRWGKIDPRNPPPPLVIGFSSVLGDGPMSRFPQSDLGRPSPAGTVGTAAAEFSPTEAGNYKLSCAIMKKVGGALADANGGNNAQHAYPVVKPRPRGKSGLTLSSKPIPPSPVLKISDVIVNITGYCAPPDPAFIAQVIVRNSGAGALPGNKTSIYLKEIGGYTQLAGPAQLIPALKPGQSANVQAIGRTLQPYMKLGGNHQIGVHINVPVWKGDHYEFLDSSEPAYVFNVKFPQQHCEAKK